MFSFYFFHFILIRYKNIHVKKSPSHKIIKYIHMRPNYKILKFQYKLKGFYYLYRIGFLFYISDLYFCMIFCIAGEWLRPLFWSVLDRYQSVWIHSESLMKTLMLQYFNMKLRSVHKPQTFFIKNIFYKWKFFCNFFSLTLFLKKL